MHRPTPRLGEDSGVLGASPVRDLANSAAWGLAVSPAWGLAGLMAALLGASIGSFAAVVADRAPRGESLGGRSHCTCGQPILARDNIPIVGYLVRRGRARCCGARIPLRFLGFEVAGAVVGVVIVATVGLTIG